MVKSEILRPPTTLRRNTDRSHTRRLVCIGDSITQGTAGGPPFATAVSQGWVKLLAASLERATGPRRGDGFRGLWRLDEWSHEGSWLHPSPAELFDVGPFGYAAYSSAVGDAVLTWSKPPDVTVECFDIWSFRMPDAGDWQFRIDDGPWINTCTLEADPTGGIISISVDTPVARRVQVRGNDGTGGCVAPILGIEPYRSKDSHPSGATVHNLGCNNSLLSQFCRDSSGDALAILDRIHPDVVTIMFSNDVLADDRNRFGGHLKKVVDRVQRSAAVLLISPYEQRPPRFITDLVSRQGDATVTSAAAGFSNLDLGLTIRGDDISADATVMAVSGPTVAILSNPATGSGKHGTVTIGEGRSAATQACYRSMTRQIAETEGCAYLDLFEVWAGIAGPGWDAAWAAGLMHDRLHPSQIGHGKIAAAIETVLGIKAV